MRPGFKYQLLSIAICLGLALPLQPLNAQPAQADSTAVRQVAIAAGDLTEALNQFAALFDISLQFNAALTNGLNTEGINGEVGIDQGFAALLAGTGLKATAEGNGVYVIAAAAEEKNAGPVQLSAIIVSGERVERSIAETASSVVVKRGEDIDRRAGIQELDDVLVSVPNVTDIGPGRAPYIRGLATQGPNQGGGAFFSGTTPRAAITVDGRKSNFFESVQGSFSTWDLQSTEVFRGPQTTSQGANSIAGAINLYTADPVFDSETRFQGQVGNFNSRRASAVLNRVLVDDEVAARIAIDHQSRDHYIDYTNPAFTFGNVDPDTRVLNARAKLLFEPQSIPELSVKVTLQHTQFQGIQYLGASEPYDDLESDGTFETSFESDSLGSIVDIEYGLSDSMVLSNQLQYTEIDTERFANGAGDAVIDATDLTNEARINFEQDSGVSGVVGLYVSDVNSDESLEFFGTSSFDDQKTGTGLYGEVTYPLTDRLDLTAGLRYQQDHIRRSGTTALIPGTSLSFNETYSEWLPKLSLGYQATPETRIGILVSRGYNPGGIGLSFIESRYVEYDKETVWNVELFSRSSLLDGRLLLNANLFYSDYKDMQRQLRRQVTPTLTETITLNADDARAYGLEVSSIFLATERLKLTGGLGLLRTKIESFPNSIDPVEGNEFDRAPQVTGNLGAIWQVTPAIELTGSARYVGEYFNDDLNTESIVSGDFWIVDVDASYEVSRDLVVSAYVSNLFDNVEPLERFVGSTDANINAPREYGIRASIRF